MYIYMMSNLQQSKSVLKFLHARGGVQVCPVVGRRCRTNFCGLGCPAYCTQPTLSAILLAFVLGGLLGIPACLLLLWTFWTSLQASSSEPSFVRPSPSWGSRCSALAGYLDEFRPNDEGHIELTSQVGDLKISIKGPAEQATQFQRKVHWGATNVMILLLLALVPLIWSLPGLLTALSFLCLGLWRRGHRSRAPSLPAQVQPPLTKKKGQEGLARWPVGRRCAFWSRAQP